MTVRVLVVDDEPDVETMFRQQFRREVRQGLFALDFAQSGADALDRLESCQDGDIVLMLSDINMPGMTGLELLPQVRSRRPALQVFILSAYGDAATVNAAINGGAARFLPKPVDFGALRQHVARTLADLGGAAS